MEGFMLNCALSAFYALCENGKLCQPIETVYAVALGQKREYALKALDPPSNCEGQTASPMLECSEVATDSRSQWKQMGEERKKVAVQEEMNRMHQLPVNSSYATHRIRVLNKILQLVSIQRSASQEEELELLFAGLSL